jgi:hypothetical protein
VDGTIIVGQNNNLPFLYVAGDLEQLPLLPGTSTGTATLISANGLTVAGYCNGRPVVWSALGASLVPSPYTPYSILNSISDDGSTISISLDGTYSTTSYTLNDSSTVGVISVEDLGEAVVTNNVSLYTPSIPSSGFDNTVIENLFCLTSDGSFQFGSEFNIYVNNFGGDYKNATNGFVTVQGHLNASAPLGNLSNFEPHSCSSDGSILAGYAVTPQFGMDIDGNPVLEGFLTGNAEISFGGNVLDLSSFLVGKGASNILGLPLLNVSTQAMSGDGSVILGSLSSLGSNQNFLATISPGVASINVDQSNFVGGNSVQATVGLDYPAPANTTVSIASDNTAVIPNTSVAVARGTMLGALTLTSTSVASPTTIILTATLGSTSSAATVTVNPLLPAITEFYPSAGTVVGGNPILGYVDLAFAAGAPGDTVSLASNNANVQVPTSVTVGSTLTAGSFSITSTPVTAVTKATITATLGSFTESTVVTVVPPTVSLVRVAPSPVVGGTSTKGAVYLNGMAPTGGLAVKVSSNNTAAVVPATITVPAGATAANTTVTTNTVNAATPVTITANTGSITVTTNLVVNPVAYPAITAFYPSAGVIVGGNAATATVTLAYAAGTGGFTVNLYSNTAGITVPPTVTVPSGKNSVTFSLQTTPVTAATHATLTASLGPVITAGTLVTVIPPSVSLVRVAPSPVVGGTSTKVAVYLNGIAPTGGFIVSVASSSVSAVVPTTITVPAGATAANATLTTSAVTVPTTVVVTAKAGTTSVETTMVVNP